MKKIFLLGFVSFITSIIFSQTIYTWKGGAGTFMSHKDYATAANWNPTKTTSLALIYRYCY